MTREQKDYIQLSRVVNTFFLDESVRFKRIQHYIHEIAENRRMSPEKVIVQIYRELDKLEDSREIDKNNRLEIRRVKHTLKKVYASEELSKTTKAVKLHDEVK